MNKQEMSVNRKKFVAKLEQPDDGRGAYVSIPFDVEKEYGSRGHIKVKAWFDEHPYRGILANMGTGCHILIVRKDIREAIGKKPGDKLTVELEHDTEARIVEMPPALKAALLKSPDAKKFFQGLSYTNQKEYCVWITSAKKQETATARLQKTIEKLLSGKKNPTEK